MQPIKSMIPVISVVKAEPFEELEALVLDATTGIPQPVAAAELARFSVAQRACFCKKHGIYQLVTTELVAFVAEQIDGRTAIEIGAGLGTLGRALQIPLTDAKLQELPEVRAYYFLSGNPVIKYPADVLGLNAAQAVQRFRPQVVVGSWITQLRPEHETAAGRSGNGYGPDEVAMLLRGCGGHRPEAYIHVGNRRTHGDKDIYRHKSLVTTKYTPDWLYTRSPYHADNFISITQLR